MWSPAVLGFDEGHFHNLDGGGSSPVSCRHVTVCSVVCMSVCVCACVCVCVCVCACVCVCVCVVCSQHWVTAPATVRSRYSLYMLCVPLRESYLSHTPTFLILVGLLSFTWREGESKQECEREGGECKQEQERERERERKRERERARVREECDC